MRPDFVPLKEARQLLGQRRYRECNQMCQAELKRDPGSPDAYYVLGIIHYEHHDFVRALKLFEMAAESGHPEPGPFVQAARCLSQMNRPAHALRCIAEAIRRNPTDGFSLSSIGATLSRMDRHREAIDFHRKATQVAPRNPLNFFNLGSSLQFMGDFEGARQAYRKALEIAPFYVPPRAHLALISQHTAESNDLEALKEAWQSVPDTDVESKLQLAHAIAKVFEDLNDVVSAMHWLDLGKSFIRQKSPSQREEDKAAFEAAMHLSTLLEPAPNSRADGPVFIVGLPRTGTTLVDRILSSHSQMVSAGERSEFSACLQESTGTVSSNFVNADAITHCANVELLQMGHRYVESVRDVIGSTERFTDKMPLNVFFVPAILNALPSARVICLRRHPADSVLSIYKQMFDPSTQIYRFAQHLEDLAEYVVMFRKLVDTYSASLPASRFTVIDYETLVDSAESEIRRALDFCGLEFEQSCLDFHENAAPVSTASVSQVRRPIYSSSKGRWMRFETQLEPALKILRARGAMAQSE